MPTTSGRTWRNGWANTMERKNNPYIIVLLERVNFDISIFLSIYLMVQIPEAVYDGLFFVHRHKHTP